MKETVSFSANKQGKSRVLHKIMDMLSAEMAEQAVKGLGLVVTYEDGSAAHTFSADNSATRSQIYLSCDLLKEMILLDMASEEESD